MWSLAQNEPGLSRLCQLLRTIRTLFGHMQECQIRISHIVFFSTSWISWICFTVFLLHFRRGQRYELHLRVSLSFKRFSCFSCNFWIKKKRLALLTQSSHLFGKVCSKLAKKVAAGQEVEGRVAPHGVKGERVHGTGELGHVMQLMLPVGRHPGKCWWRSRRPLCSRCFRFLLWSCCGSAQDRNGHSSSLARPDRTQILQDRNGDKLL